MELEKIILLIKNKLVTGKFSEAEKIDIDNAFEILKSKNDGDIFLKCIDNILQHIRTNQYSTKFEDELDFLVNMALQLIAMYGKNEKIIDTDETIVFEVVNAMKLVDYSHYKGITDAFVNPIFVDPLIGFKKNPEQNCAHIIQNITRNFADAYPNKNSSDEEFIALFIEENRHRLYPKEALKAKTEEKKKHMKKIIKEYSEQKPNWMERFAPKSYLVDELYNLSAANLDKFFIFEVFLKMKKVPEVHIVHDELKLIHIAEFIDISILSEDQIDDILQVVSTIEMDEYEEVLTPNFINEIRGIEYVCDEGEFDFYDEEYEPRTETIGKSK